MPLPAGVMMRPPGMGNDMGPMMPPNVSMMPGQSMYQGQDPMNPAQGQPPGQGVPIMNQGQQHGAGAMMNRQVSVKSLFKSYNIDSLKRLLVFQ